VRRPETGTATSWFKSALDRADLCPGQAVNVAGIKSPIGGSAQLLAKAMHAIDGGPSFATSLELERWATA
jgi:phage protein D